MMASCLLRYNCSTVHTLSRTRLCRSWQLPRLISFFSTSNNKKAPNQPDEATHSDETSPQPLCAVTCLRTTGTGTGQVVFLNSPQAGAAILASLAVCDPCLAIHAGLGSWVSTVTAETALTKGNTEDGLYSYNGCLVGCASYALVVPGDFILAVPITIVGAATATFVSATPMTTPMPQWTFAFNILTYTTLLALYKPAVSVATADAVVPSMFDLMVSPLTGLGQVFVAESPLTGLGIAAAMALYGSPRIAVHAIIGSAVGNLTASGFLSADPASIAAGLWGYNAALTSAGTAVFLKNTESTNAHVWTVSVVGASVTALVSAAMSNGSPVPILTLPFCTVMSGIWWLAQGKQIRHIELNAPPTESKG